MSDISAPPASPNEGRGLRYAMIGGLAVTAIAVVFGAVIFGVLLYFQRISSIPSLLPADTQFYAALRIDLRDLPGIAQLQARVPELFDDATAAPATDPLEELLGVDFSTQITPWVGQEMAVAIRDLDVSALETLDSNLSSAEQGETLFLIASRDDPALERFLDSLIAQRETENRPITQRTIGDVTIYSDASAEGTPAAHFALIKHYLVLSNRAEALEALSARADDAPDSLANDATFQEALRTLPDNPIGTLFVAGSLTAALGDAAAASAELPSELGDSLELLSAVRSFAATITVPGDGVTFDTAISFDLSQVPADLLSQLEAARAPIDPLLIRDLDASTIAAFSARLPELPPEVGEAADELGSELGGLGWLQGELVASVYPADPASNPLEAPIAARIGLRSPDLAAAEQGVTALLQFLADLSGTTLETATVDGEAWQVLSQEGVILIGQRRAEDRIELALLETAMRAPASGSQLRDDEVFLDAIGDMISPNGGVIFVRPADLAALSSEELPADLAWLNQLSAITVTGAPGVDSSGIARAKVKLLLGGE